MIVAQSVTHLVATVGFGVCTKTGFAPCSSIYDLDHNNGISDNISTLVIAVAALGAGALGARRRPREAAAFGLAALLALVMFDDVFHFEDTVSSGSGVIVLATIVSAAALTIRVARGVAPETRLLLLLGVAILALDARAPFFYDQLMNAVGHPDVARGDLLYELGVVLDEAMELAGWLLVAIGIWDAALAAPRAIVEGQPIR